MVHCELHGKKFYIRISHSHYPMATVSENSLLQPNEFHQQGEGSSMLSIISEHRTHTQEMFPDRSTFVKNLFHTVFWTALNTKGISAGDSRCYLIWIKNNNDVYQSNEAFRGFQHYISAIY